MTLNAVTQIEKKNLISLSIAALGVVYGDLGTSPLYAMRETLRDVPLTPINIFGTLSLIFWTLTLVISFKYLIILLRADNDGEGGILSLLALVKHIGAYQSTLLFVLAIFGAGFIIGDGMLTPAISVLSAIEGMNVIFTGLSHWIVPITTIILLGLFAIQSYGTSKIGGVFGPIIFIWFVCIAILGLISIIHYPSVLKAINPIYAVEFFKQLGWHGYVLLGGIFLVATGAEALYADLGHFGKLPIQLTWFSIAFPALLLNYFGQGALLLQKPEAIANPFYLLAPSELQLPLLIIATLATIIASQAVISATFSLTRQAILQGLYPRLPIIQTSLTERGQIYIPQMNIILTIGTLFLIFTFETSDALAHAYGIAVNLNMVTTTLLALVVALKLWHWPAFWVVLTFLVLSFIDLAFLGANAEKIMTGGWVPIVFASACAYIMYTWQRGRDCLQNLYYMKPEDLNRLVTQLNYENIMCVPNTSSVFITDVYDKTGGAFFKFLKLNHTMPENVLLVNYATKNVPYVPSSQRYEVHKLGAHICEVTLNYGYMDTISVPLALYNANDRGLLPFSVNIDTTNYFIEIPNVVASSKVKSLDFFWQEKLFAFLVRNYSANMDIEFYQLPFDRTVAMGSYYVL